MDEFQNQTSSRFESRRPAKPLSLAMLLAAATLTPASAPGMATADDEVEAAMQREQEALELMALGYVTWTEVDPEELARTLETPALTHAPERVETGVNFFCSEPSDSVRFFDMQGETLWELETEVPDPVLKDNRCKLIEFHGTDHILMLHERTQISAIDWNSGSNWSLRGRYHHDLAVDAHGDIYALFDHQTDVPAIDPDGPIYDTDIVRISATGEIVSRISLASLVAEHEPMLEGIRENPRGKPDRGFRARIWGAYHTLYCENMLKEFAQTHSDFFEEFLGPTCSAAGARRIRRPWDVFHVNTLEFIETEQEFAGGVRIPAGALLISIRELDTIAIIDLEQEQILWTWGIGELEEQHHPSMLANGNILIFDNGVRRGFSRLVELDPRAGEIVWTYQADPPGDFFTESRGAAEVLPGGNFLVTESEKGRIFEVTRSGEVVWEYWNPDASKDGKKRATIYRAGRLFPNEFGKWGWPGPPITETPSYENKQAAIGK